MNKMKVTIFALVAILISVTSIHSFASNHEIATFTDEPQRIAQYAIINETTLMPVNVLSTALGATFSENPLTGIASLSKGNITLTFDTKFKTNMINEYEIEGYEQPHQVNDGIYISSEFVIDVFGNNISMNLMELGDKSNDGYDLSVLLLGRWQMKERVIEENFYDGILVSANYRLSEETFDYKNKIRMKREKLGENNEFGNWEETLPFNGITSTYKVDRLVNESIQREAYVMHAYDYTILDNKKVKYVFSEEKSWSPIDGIDMLPLTKTIYVDTPDKITVTTILSNKEISEVGIENVLKEITIINTFERVNY